VGWVLVGWVLVGWVPGGIAGIGCWLAGAGSADTTALGMDGVVFAIATTSAAQPAITARTAVVESTRVVAM
jgi:hypothetical protein